MNISEEILKDARDGYDELDESLNNIASNVNSYKGDVESYLYNKDGKLDEWIDDLRAKGYGGAAACALVFFLCPIVYAATATGVEVSISNAKNQLAKQKEDADTAYKIVENVLAEVKKGKEFIHAEYPLIKLWKSEIGEAKSELDSAELVLGTVRRGCIKPLVKGLDDLKQACISYLDHSADTLLLETTTMNLLDTTTEKSNARRLVE